MESLDLRTMGPIPHDHRVGFNPSPQQVVELRNLNNTRSSGDKVCGWPAGGVEVVEKLK